MKNKQALQNESFYTLVPNNYRDGQIPGGRLDNVLDRNKGKRKKYWHLCES
jgi:hypothetical protein